MLSVTALLPNKTSQHNSTYPAGVIFAHQTISVPRNAFMLNTIAKKTFHALKARCRSLKRWLIAEQTLAHLQCIRTHELLVVAEILPSRKRLLEIGAGTGWQAHDLAQRGYQVSAIDLPASKYAEDRVFPVIDYDGQTIPFDDSVFDIVYTSNLLEHIPHLDSFQKEIRRVLQADGFVIHVLPSGSWRFWSNLSHIVRYRTWPHPHGEHAANAIEEIGLFSKRAWRQTFRDSGWQIAAERSNGLFYTGSSILDARLGIKMRRRLSRLLGSSCNIFVLRTSDL
ncbi:MAG: methyltransferase domain-containing protein [Dechloromonas sp.]|nr:MAG: methyltransferase domain-containing protein [Dechloromonas sp.]